VASDDRRFVDADGGGLIPWYVVAALAAFAVRCVGQAPNKRPRKMKNTAASMHRAAHR
jgi:hypothetical protein